MSRFQDALALTLQHEGGYVCDPADPGGATNQGITQGKYDEWRRWNGLSERPVKRLERHELEAIYFSGYWKEGRCDEMPARVAVVHFDACVNCGPAAAAKILQRAVGVEDDGIIGPVTLGALSEHDEETAVNAMLWERLRYCREITRDESNALIEMARYMRLHRFRTAAGFVDKAEGLKFIRWWIKRILDLREAV